MINQESRSERIAIKMDSHISESEDIRQTDAEMKSKELPESIAKAKALQQKIKLDHADKMAKKSNRFTY